MRVLENNFTNRFTTIYDMQMPSRYVRSSDNFGYSKDVLVMGDDLKGRDCIIINDMIDTV